MKTKGCSLLAHDGDVLERARRSEQRRGEQRRQRQRRQRAAHVSLAAHSTARARPVLIGTREESLRRAGRVITIDVDNSARYAEPRYHRSLTEFGPSYVSGRSSESQNIDNLSIFARRGVLFELIS